MARKVITKVTEFKATAPKSKIADENSVEGTPTSKKRAHRGRKSSVPPNEGWKQRIVDVMHERRLSARSVSLKAGLNAASLKTALRPGRRVGAETVLAFAQALGMSVEYLLTGAGSTSPQAGGNVQRVPVLAPGSVVAFCNSDKEHVDTMRYDICEPIDPQVGRFRLDVAGNSMAGDLSDGDTIDCSTALDPQPEDIVVAWSAWAKTVVVRRLMPTSFDERGRPRTGELVATNKAWPRVQFSVDNGDRLLAVVFNVQRPLRRMVRSSK
jgi:phage repressor protein C with HTH and peptisase S24 domain